VRQSEIWLVHFMPQIGTEITKTRPAVIVSSDVFSHLPRRLVVPLRERKPDHARFSFFTAILPTEINGLGKLSSADCSQVKSFDIKRFVRKLGIISHQELEVILDGIELYIGR
jgi:mRNA interferase MazF